MRSAKTTSLMTTTMPMPVKCIAAHFPWIKWEFYYFGVCVRCLF